jgi:hypothetical protein
MRLHRNSRLLLVAALAGSLSCGGGSDGAGPNPPPPPVPTSLVVSAGDGQAVEVGLPAPINPAVQVKDQSGDGMEGVSVTFAVTGGGGSVAGSTRTTNANGVAIVDSWTMGPLVSINQLTASVNGLTSVVIRASGLVGPADTIKIQQGSGQTVPAGAQMTIAPIVEVEDRYGNSVPGVTVGFTAGQGGTVTPTATTNLTGLATATWTVGGQLGLNSMSASVVGLAPAVFTATVFPGAPTVVTKTAGDNQTGPAGVRLPVDLTISVSDQFGNPVPGHLAQLSALNGGGQLFTQLAVTNDSGLARIGWAPRLAGLNSVTLRIVGVDITFTSTSLVGPAASLQPIGSGLVGTAGQPVVAGLVGVHASDLGGNPVAGVPVTFTALSGSGSITGGSALSDNGGQALVGGWTLGTQIGVDSLLVTSLGLPSLHLTSIVAAGPVVAIEKTVGDNQSLPVSEPVPTLAFRTIDQYGNPSPFVPMVFAVMSGGGTLGFPTFTTTDLGLGFVQYWSIGPIPGPNTLEVRAEGTAITALFTINGVPRPGSVTKTAGDNQTAAVGASLPVDPTILIMDTQGQPLPGVVILWSVLAGGGGVSHAPDTTDANGVASVQWTMGTGIGTHTLLVSGNNVPGAVFTATATAGPAASVQLVAGDGQTQVVAMPVSTKPAVSVKDQFNNPVSGLAVDFTVVAGGGSVSGGSAVTGTDGVATVGDWILGSVPGLNQLEALVSGAGISGNPVGFTATGLISNYDVDVRAISALTPNQQAAFDAAEARLEGLVIGDVPDFPLSLPATSCGINHPAVNETVDDVIIFAQVVAIDGPGGILGAAGPCVFRTASHMTIVGIMHFDAADLPSIEAQGLLDEVILHEMQHVLGLGSLWLQRGLLSGAGGPDPFFTGPAALTAFNSIGGLAYPGPKVPVENQGGPGTRDGHWRESVFGNELMTGFLNSGNNPLSIVTVNSFQDYGYQVNSGAADAFVVGPFPAPAQRVRPRLALTDDLWRGPLFEVDPAGRVQPVARP